jgi:hypothetical protein
MQKILIELVEIQNILHLRLTSKIFSICVRVLPLVRALTRTLKSPSAVLHDRPPFDRNCLAESDHSTISIQQRLLWCRELTLAVVHFHSRRIIHPTVCGPYSGVQKVCTPSPASVPTYTYFQNLVIQAAHFSYPEAFALAGEGTNPTYKSNLIVFLPIFSGYSR